MQNADIEKNARPLNTTSKEQAHSEKLHEQINVADVNSIGTESKTSFLNRKAGCQPCMSLLYAISDAKLFRSEIPAEDKVSFAKYDRMHKENILHIRENCKRDLRFLVNHDSGIHLEDARLLCAAIVAIDRAVIVA